MITATILIESLDAQGRVTARERFALTPDRHTFTIGRGVDADVIVDDAYAAALHAAIEVGSDGRLLVHDLGSANGILVAGRRYTGARNLALPDGRLRVGRTSLRVRTSQQQLEPERKDRSASCATLFQPASIAMLAGAATALQLFYASWLTAPRDLMGSLISSFTIAAPAITVWVAVWGLLTRVMHGEWRFLRHMGIGLGISAAFTALTGAVDLSSFAFSLPPMRLLVAWMTAAALGIALYLHLITASNLTRRSAVLTACLLPALYWGGSEWLQYRNRLRDVGQMAPARNIYPPEFRLRAAVAPADFFKSTVQLRTVADAKRKAAQALDPDDDEK